MSIKSANLTDKKEKDCIIQYNPEWNEGKACIYFIVIWQVITAGSTKIATYYDRKSEFEFVVWSDEEYPPFFGKL